MCFIIARVGPYPSEFAVEIDVSGREGKQMPGGDVLTQD